MTKITKSILTTLLLTTALALPATAASPAAVSHHRFADLRGPLAARFADRFSEPRAMREHKPATKSADSSATKSFTGTLSDSMCGKSHMMAGKSPAECAKECAKDGDYALVVGDKVYTLKGHKPDLEKLAGANATVTGTVKGDTIDVATVAAATAPTSKTSSAKPATKKS